MTDKQFSLILKKAETEGLKPSTFAKRSTIVASRETIADSTHDILRFRKNQYNVSEYTPKATCPVTAAKAMKEISTALQECFVVISLTAKKDIIKKRITAIGTSTGAPISFKDVFRGAIEDNAISIIVGHNHPSGDVIPSAKDRSLTESLKKAGEILRITVNDHIIVSQRGFFSILEGRKFNWI